MLAASEPVAFATATDGDRTAAFYGGVLGLPLVERTTSAVAFSAPNATLRVALAERVTPSAGTILGPKVDEVEARIDELAYVGGTAMTAKER